MQASTPGLDLTSASRRMSTLEAPHRVLTSGVSVGQSPRPQPMRVLVEAALVETAHAEAVTRGSDFRGGLRPQGHLCQSQSSEQPTRNASAAANVKRDFEVSFWRLLSDAVHRATASGGSMSQSPWPRAHRVRATPCAGLPRSPFQADTSGYPAAQAALRVWRLGPPRSPGLPQAPNPPAWGPPATVGSSRRR